MLFFVKQFSIRKFQRTRFGLQLQPSCASIHNKDFVLVSSTNAYKWQVARMEHHFEVQGVVYSIVTFCTCIEYFYSSHSAQVQIQDQLQLIETSAILCPLIYAEEERATRVLIPWAYRPSKD